MNHKKIFKRKAYYYLYFALLPVIWVGCKSRAIQDEAGADTTQVADYKGPLLAFQNIETVYSQMGEARLILTAPLQYREQSGDERFPEGINIDIYDEAGLKKTLIIADSGRYASEQRLYIMMGNVSVTNLIAQQRLETDILYWDERYREIYTDTTVKITTPKEIINGVGLRAKQDFSQYKIMRPTGIISASGL